MPSGVYERTQEHRENLGKSMSIVLKGKKRKPYKIDKNKPYIPRHTKPHTQETKDKIRESQIGKKASDETKAKMSKSRKGKSFTDEHKSSLKEMWKRPEYRMKIVKAQASRQITSIEIKVKKQLDYFNIKYEQQKVISNGRFVLDFYIPEQKLVIECNGDYWHNRPERRERDKKLEEYVLSKNRKILWLWEHEINESDFNIIDYLEI